MRIIAGALGGRKLKTAEGPGYRPAMSRVREALFSMLESRGLVWQAVNCLDLFAGSGSLGFEALSRGGASAVFVESGKGAARVLRENAEALALLPARRETVRIVEEDCARFLAKRANRVFDLVFIDPPYGDDVLQSTLFRLLKNGWLSPDALVVAEISVRAQLDAEKLDSRLELVVDRLYGQTRILIWNLLT